MDQNAEQSFYRNNCIVKMIWIKIYFLIWTGGFIFHFILQSMTISHFFLFFLAYFRNDMGKGSFLLLNVKWNTLSLTGKELSAAFLPCTHLTVTTRTCRREVFKHFKRGLGGGVIKLNRRDWQDVPGSILFGWEDWQSERSTTFKLEEHCLLLHFSDIQN